MSQLLFDWLNDDVRLSRKVIAFREDFQDGYLLGELLSKFNQQLDFNQFSTKGTPAAKLNNFCLLEPTMRKIGVHFNSRVVTEIMAGKETITKNLLYEMKTALEGVYRINKQSNNQMLHGTASDKALHVIKPTRPSYEKTISSTFEKAVHGTIENTNEVMMAEVVKRHASKAVDYLQTMSTADSDAYDAFMNTRLREKEINRNKKEKADEFAKTREAQHVAQWKVNQRVAHDRRSLKAKVENDLLTRQHAVHSRFLAATRQDTLHGVDSFSDRLDASLLVAGADSAGDADSLIKTTTNVPGDNNLTLMYVDPATQRKGLETTQKKMKEHHEDIAVRTKAHDQRRRKFLREYDTMQMKLSQKIFHTEVIAQMLNFAASEKVEQGQVDEAVNYKKIIPENRHNREDLMERMAEADRQRGVEWEAVKAQREVHWTIGGARASHGHRSEVLQGAVAAADRQASTAVALQTVDKLLDVVEWVVSCRQVGVFHYQVTQDPPVLTAALPEAAAAGGKKGKEKEKAAPAATVAPAADEVPKPRSCDEGAVVPRDVWADAVKMFVAEEPVSVGLQIPAPLTVTDALWPFSISDRPACTELDWLFAQPFHAAQLLHTDATAAPSSPKVTLEETTTEPAAPSMMKLASTIAAADVSDFIGALNTAEIATGLADEGRSATEAPPAAEVSTLYTPTWLTNVEPRHFLGETIVAVRCAVDPVPDEPAAVVDTKHIPLRVALCGVSELAKKNLVEAMVREIPGLTVIAVGELVDRAFQYHRSILDSVEQSASADAVAQEFTAPAEATEGLFAIQESTELSESSEVEEFSGPVPMELPTPPGEAGTSGKEAAATTVDGDVVAEAPTLIDETAAAPQEAVPDPFAALARDVHACLLAGQVIPDELYVSLVVYAVQQIHQRNTGYVLQDFPTSKRQALLLMEAFSGMNYDSHRAQPTDKASRYAPTSPAAEWTFNIAKCGLDAVVHVDNGTGVDTAFDQRARARRVTESGAVVYISDDQVTIKGLEAVNDPSRPFYATGIDLTVAQAANDELLAFCRRVNILQQFELAAYGTAEEAVAIKAQQLRDSYVPAEYFLPGYLPGTEPPAPEPEPQPEVEESQPEPEPQQLAEPADETALEGGEGAEGQTDGAVVAAEGAPAADPSGAEPAVDAAAEPATVEERAPEEVKEKYIYQAPPAIFQPNAIPLTLAEALLRMWNTSEEQSTRKSAAYFSGVRDVRYQMLQRRRAGFDCVSTLLVKLDNRQELFDAFRKTFNGVPPDMRFDPECVAELHLQKLELCDALLKISETRKATAETYTKKVGADGVVTVLQHRVRCESVAMGQSELQRFFVVLHLIFDYSKSVRGYAMHAKVLNELEAALPVTLPAENEGGKKDKAKEAKKGKEAPGALVPFREPIAAVLVPRAGVEAVPEVNGGEEPADPKAKKAPAKVIYFSIANLVPARHNLCSRIVSYRRRKGLLRAATPSPTSRPRCWTRSRSGARACSR
jgi:hypothetical protein